MTQIDHSEQGYPQVNAECRALTVRENTPACVVRGTPHRSAAFVAQLLAVRDSLPQARERRREEPDIAAHAYEARMAPASPGQGKVLSRAA